MWNREALFLGCERNWEEPKQTRSKVEGHKKYVEKILQAAKQATNAIQPQHQNKQSLFQAGLLTGA